MPSVMSSGRRGGLCEARHGESHAGEAAHDLVLALHTVREQRADERSHGLGHRDDERVFETVGHVHTARNQQCREPGIEAVESNHLGRVEYRQHEGSTAIAAPKYIGKPRAGRDGLRRRPCPEGRERTELCEDARLEAAHQAIGLVDASLGGQPARTLRNACAQRPDHDRADRAEQHHPAPSRKTERRQRHELPGEQRHHRHGGEANALIQAERAAAQPRRDELDQVGVDGHELHAETHAGDESPEVEPLAGDAETP